MLTPLKTALAAFAATVLAVSARAAGEIISVNFGAPIGTSEETVGLAPAKASTWIEAGQADSGSLGGTGGNVSVIRSELSDQQGQFYGAFLAIASRGGTWHRGNQNSLTGKLLYGFLDDSSANNEACVEVRGVPFSKYTVYVYFNGDFNDGATNKFPAYEINGKGYKGDGSGTVETSTAEAWGTVKAGEVIEGVNVLKVEGQTATTLRVYASHYSSVFNKASVDGTRGCIAALQIVNTGTLRSYERNLSGDGVWEVASGANDWGAQAPAKPAEESSVSLTVSSDATLTMNATTSLATLLVKGDGKLTFAADGTNALSAGDTFLHANMDASSGVAALGAVTIGAGKTLTVGGAAIWDSLAFANTSATLRIFSDTALSVLPDNRLRKSGTYILDCPLTLVDAPLAFGTGSGSAITQDVTLRKDVTAVRLVTGDGANNVTRIVQEGGNITLSQTDTDINSGGAGAYAILFGHWASTSDYRLAAGSVTAENGYAHLGWDGTAVTVTVGQSLEAANGTTALLKVKGLTGNLRGNPATLTVNPSGTLAIGSAGFMMNKSNKHVFLAGGTLLAYENLTTALTANGLEITAPSTVAAATGATLTIDKLVGNETTSLTIGSSENAGNVVLPNLSSFSGNFRVNAGTLRLPAGMENKVLSVENGASLEVALSSVQQMSDYTADVKEGVTVTFVDGEGRKITDGVEGNTYKASPNTWTATISEEDGTYRWENVENWSKGALPAETDSVRVSLSKNTTLTLGEPVTVANLSVTVTEEGTLTLAGAKLTVSEQLIAETGVVASDATLSAGAIQVNEGCEVDYSVAVGALNLPPLTGAGTFRKRGLKQANLRSANDCEPSLVVESGTLLFDVENYTKVYNVTAKSGATIQIGTWAGAISSSASSLRLEGGAVLRLNNGNTDNGGSLVAAKIYVSSATDENPAVIRGNNYGGNGNLTGGIEGVGTLRLESTDDNPFKISGAIRDGADGKLKVVVATNRGVTFSGANTYTGGTVVTEGSTLTIDGERPLPEYGKENASGVVTVEAGATLELKRGMSYAYITGEGTVKVKGNFIAGLGNNGSDIKAPVEVAEGGTLAIRDFRGVPLTLPGLTLVGTVKQDDHSGSGVQAATLAITGTLSGAGRIEVPLTFAVGSTLDASAGAPTVTGEVTMPTEGTVTVGGAMEEGQTVLTCTNPAEVAPCLLGAPAGFLFAANDEGTAVVLKKPALTLAGGITGTLSTEAAAALETLAAENGLATATISGATKNGTVALTAEAIGDALELFANVASVNVEAKTITVVYDFGIASLTLRQEEGNSYLWLAAKVQGAEGVAYAEGTTVEVWMDDAKVEDSIATEMAKDPEGNEPAEGVKWFRILYAQDATAPLRLKVKATKATTP